MNKDALMFQPPVGFKDAIRFFRNSKAQALLRRLSEKPLTTISGRITGPEGKQRLTRLPAINRYVKGDLGFVGSNKQPTLFVEFGKTFGDLSEQFSSDKNRTIKATPEKRAALLWMLGDLLQRQPENSEFNAVGVDELRRRLYRMMTGGAMGNTGKGRRVNADTYQPRNAKGQLQPHVNFVPKDLKKPLEMLARHGGAKAILSNNPYAQAFLLANDVIEGVTGKNMGAHYKDIATDYKQQTGVSLNPVSFFP